MSNENEILKELNALNCALGGLSRRMPFDIPSGYFEKLPADLTEFSKNENEPLTAFSDTKKMPFDLPQNYFKTLPERLTTTTSFAGSQVEQVNEVPQGYFESLPERLTMHVKARNSRKRLTIPLVSFRKIRWAAAAVLMICASVGTLQFVKARSAPDAVAARQLAKIDPGDIAGYVDQQLDDFDNENLESAATSHKIDFNTTLSTIDAPSIQQYLDNTGEFDSQPLN